MRATESPGATQHNGLNGVDVETKIRGFEGHYTGEPAFDEAVTKARQQLVSRVGKNIPESHLDLRNDRDRALKRLQAASPMGDV